jgi:hypothetical protein
MAAKDGTPNDGAQPAKGPHEKFLELCAVSTTGSLTEEERKELEEHLAGCLDCRAAKKQFEKVVDRAIPALAGELASETPTENPAFSERAAEASFFKRLSEEKKRSLNRLEDVEAWNSPLVVRRRQNFRRSIERYHLWFPLAAVVLLCVSFGILTYRMGKHRGVDVTRREFESTRPGMVLPQNGVDPAIHDSSGSDVELAQRNKAIAELRLEIARQATEITRLKAIQSEQGTSLQASAEKQKELAGERDRLSLQIAEGQATLEASENRLRNLERERAEGMFHTGTLETKVAELSRVVLNQQHRISEQEDLLAKDRDIRELMGARDLYVAEVYDVERTGETQKAFGRVYCTKGKSLIFYAYDLDEEPGWKNTNAFQAWGMHGADRTQAFNLGMFYEDNISKKRWVLKFDDPKTLAQIDAVFVTAEPNGGSHKPSGKPFLFAYLKIDANHP